MSSHITYPDAVAIAQLAYYSPALLISFWISYKHGFSRGSGWVFLVIFCIIRIVGSGAQLATINNSDIKTAETIALIAAVLGLSPLLLATLGIMARIYNSILKQPWNTFFSMAVLRAIQIPTVVALVLCIVGATNTSNPAQIEQQTTVHVGIILFAAVFGVLVVLDGGALLGSRITHRGEVPLIVGVTLALPFLTVRMVYALIADFAHDSRFNPATGSTTIRLFMEVLQEMAIVLIYLITGFMSPTAPKADNVEHRSGAPSAGFTPRRGNFSGRRLGLISLAIAAGQALNEKRNQRHHSGNRASPAGYPLDEHKAQGMSPV